MQVRVFVAVHDGGRAKQHVQQCQPHQPEHQQGKGAGTDRFVGKGGLIGPSHQRQADTDQQQHRGKNTLDGEHD
ncbi:hypothetical protein D3C78_1766140 [compost metagenome]